MKLNKNYQVLILFCVTSVLIRFLSFFPSVIDHDESTYLVIAQEMLKGKILYVDTIDVKPAGIFLILALLRLIFGNSIFIVRLFTALIIAFTSYLIFRIKLNNGSDSRAALAAGFIYIFMLSVFTFFGISVNTETYFNLFTIAGLLFILKKNSVPGNLIAGVLLGCGFIIKYVVLFDFVAFIIFFMILSLRRSKSLFYKSFVHAGIMTAGFIIPFGLINLYYFLIGHYDDFLFHTFEVTRNYPVERDALETIKYILDFHIRFLPVIFFFYYCLFDKSLKTENIKTEKLLIIIWVIFDLAAILYPGKYFGHYFIQLMLPVSLFAGNFFDVLRKLPVFLNRLITIPFSYVFILILVSVIVLTQKKDYIDKPDYSRQISKYLATQIAECENIYTGNYHQVIYYLLDKSSPARYVHRSLIRAPHHIEALRIDVNAEINKIIKARPAYIINQGDIELNELYNYISRHYVLVRTFEKDVNIYKRVINEDP